jgi:hypothetical protein
MNAMRTKIRYTLLALAIALLTPLFHQLLWGKLFPYSPVKIGFTKHALEHVVIFAQDGCDASVCETVDARILDIEAFHGRRFTHKPEILVFHDSMSYLSHSATKARFYAYPNGNIVVSPWAVREARDGTISMNTYLAHELSHSLLCQHMNFVIAYFFFPRWLLEGIAVCSVNQMGTSWYPSRSQTYAYIRQGNFLPPDYFNTSREDQVPLNVPYRSAFAFSEFACLVDYLKTVYGSDKFERYVTELLDSCNPKQVFHEVYGIEFETCLQDFKKYVQEHH